MVKSSEITVSGDQGVAVKVFVHESTLRENHSAALVWAHGGGAVALTAE